VIDWPTESRRTWADYLRERREGAIRGYLAAPCGSAVRMWRREDALHVAQLLRQFR
jgi:uncharacterized protein (DUF2336 family)